MEKLFYGYCAVQKCEYCISVTYHPDGNGGYVRGLMDCKYRRLHQTEACKDCEIVKEVTPQP